jgi:putative ABC transport system permease protein
VNIFSATFRLVQLFWTLLQVTLRQLFAQRGLTAAVLAGLLTTTAIAMSIPIYADAVYQDILETQLGGAADDVNRRPPFGFMFRYIGSWEGPVAYENTLAVDEYLAGRAVADLNLPLELFSRYYKSVEVRLFRGEESKYEGLLSSLAYVNFGAVSSLEEHIVLLEGRMPSGMLVNGRVEVLVAESFANKLGLQRGETYLVFERVSTSLGEVNVEIPVVISGIWRASDPGDPYWFYNISEFDIVLLVDPQAFSHYILPSFHNEVNLALWYLVMDGSDVKASDVPQVVRRIMYTRQRAFNYLPGLRMDISPLEELRSYQEKYINLTRFLYTFSLPLMGMVLSFISLVSSMAIQQRRTQIITLRSRGATSLQLFGMAVFESVLLGGASLALAVPLAALIASLMGRTRSFLDFSAHLDLTVRIPDTAWQVGLLVVVFNLLAQALPMLDASRYTIVTYKQERSRQVRPPWWQRFWLDILILIPIGYGIYLLRKPGGHIAGLPNDPFQNPLLLLLPALTIFGLTLVLLRLLPRLMQGLAWLAGRTAYVGILLAARRLARLGSDFNAPLILLVFTLSLSMFTASMAQTVDRYLVDKNYYEIGADVSLDETGELNPGLREFTFGGNVSQASQESRPEPEGPRWFFLPVSEHLRVPGIRAATRIGSAQARLSLPGGAIQGRYLGIDRLDFPKVSYWRDDFAPEPLGGLMNNLALTLEGVLIPRSLLQEHSLEPGDTLIATVNMLGEAYELEFMIVGVFDLFPAWDPQDGPLIVGNLDYLYERIGTVFPYDVLVETEPGVAIDKIVEGLDDLGIIVLNYNVSEQRLNQEQLRPERQGLFGLLSIGFLALAFLTVLGFFLYALFSFRGRFIELGILRAVGLSSGQLVLYLAGELVFLLLVGLGAGTGLGIWTSNMFIPILQMGSGPEASLPPFIIEIGWLPVFRIYLLFGLLFISALCTLSALLLRMKIFQAIKMGEMV